MLTAVVFAVGTMAGSLGPTMFGHLPDALALFAAFVLGTRARRARDWLWVGLLAGDRRALRVSRRRRRGDPRRLRRAPRRQAGGTRDRWRAASRRAVVLGGYDWIAFGAPWRLSYRYTSNVFTGEQQQNLFGVGVPSPNGIWTLLLDGHGLLLVSPVLLAAIAGLVLFWRRSRLEAAVAIAIAFVFCLYTAGYFLPNGGLSPGPRFATAALPFLLLGLPFALARWRSSRSFLRPSRSGVGLFDELTWSVANRLEFLTWPATVWSLLGLSHELGALILLAFGAAAGLVALVVTASGPRPEPVVHSLSTVTPSTSAHLESTQRGRKGVR